jgi:hypothetical protein
VSDELRTVLRLKHQAQAAAAVASQPNPEEGHEMAAAYERLREEARVLHNRAGWGDDEAFERQLPRLQAQSIGSTARVARIVSSESKTFEAAAAGSRARVLLGQLAGWAAGHQEALELEERLRADIDRGGL